MSKKELIRSYDEQIDRVKVEDLERKCSVGPAGHVFLYTDTMGDPICRIRNSPLYTMLVAELNNEIIGVIQGSIKLVTLHKPPKDLAKVGYILGLRVSPHHRRKGIAYHLVRHLEDWFIANQADYAYMATEKANYVSVNLFINKLGYAKFRTPTILVNPVTNRHLCISKNTVVAKLKVEQAEFLYRKFMGSAEFFPKDIDKVLKNKLSLGTWVAYPRGGGEFGEFGRVPESWAMVSVWNSGGLFKMRIGRAKLSCWLYKKGLKFLEWGFPCLSGAELPEFFRPFGFYFVYGVHGEGAMKGKLLRILYKFVHNMAVKEIEECKFVVTEIGDCSDGVKKVYIPHWKWLSSGEDLWCIKELKSSEEGGDGNGGGGGVCELTGKRALFVDPREV
ncbi:hypothetical protein LguiB_031060 [Lonicera macranthoides]